MDKDLKELGEFANFPSNILSVYLGSAEKQTPSSEVLITQLHSLVHHNLDQASQKVFLKDIEKIEKYLRESYDKRGKRTAAFFVSSGKLLKVLEFEFYLPPMIVISYSPYLKPITDALNKYQRYLVVLADREKSKMFTVYLGKIEEQREIFDGDVSKRERTKVAKHLKNHLGIIADVAEEFAHDKNINFVILGGHKELLPEIKKHLNYPLNKMVLGEFITELEIPLNELLLHSKKVVSKTYALE